MMFADDIVVYSESREQVHTSFLQRYALKKRRIKVSRSKAEYMCVNDRKTGLAVKLEEVDAMKVDEFGIFGINHSKCQR